GDAKRDEVGDARVTSELPGHVLILAGSGFVAAAIAIIGHAARLPIHTRLEDHESVERLRHSARFFDRAARASPATAHSAASARAGGIQASRRGVTSSRACLASGSAAAGGASVGARAAAACRASAAAA